MLKAFLFCFFGLATDYFPAFEVHRSLTLIWYNQCNGGYDEFVTAGTISFKVLQELTQF